MKKGNLVAVVECKHYRTKKVGRPEIQKFHSAMTDTKARKGYFVTTSDFTQQAIQCARNKNIELINRKKLLALIGQVKK